MAKTPPVIKQDETNPVPVEILAQSITSISQAFQKIKDGPLTERALVLLIQDNTTPQVSQANIRAVLASIRDLERTYVKKK